MISRKIVALIVTALVLAGCGQTGALFIAQSEAEHNDGHFMTSYKKDEN